MNEMPPRPNRSWDVLCHLSALAMFLAIPFGNILGPLVIWLLKKDELGSVDAHGKESLNFQISLSLYLLAFAGLTVMLMFILIGFLMVPMLVALAAVMPIVDTIFVVIASLKASNGEFFRYPLTIRLIR